jgi:hypothetical protein
MQAVAGRTGTQPGAGSGPATARSERVKDSQRIPAGSTAVIEEVRFAADSPLEGDGFEPSVPPQGDSILVPAEHVPFRFFLSVQRAFVCPRNGSFLTRRWSKADSNSGSHPRAPPPAATRFVADSALEGDGFELPVREHRAMAPSTDLPLPPTAKQRSAGRPPPMARSCSEAQRGSVRPAAAMRSTHREIRPGENVTLQYLSHDGRPAPPRRASRRHRTFANGKIPAARPGRHSVEFCLVPGRKRQRSTG